MSKPPTDEQLDEWEKLAGGPDADYIVVANPSAIRVLIQEVRRLREVSTGYFEMNKKAEAALEAETKLLGKTQLEREKAEAEVERLRGQLHFDEKDTSEKEALRYRVEQLVAERDRYKAVVDAAREVWIPDSVDDGGVFANLRDALRALSQQEAS